MYALVDSPYLTSKSVVKKFGIARTRSIRAGLAFACETLSLPKTAKSRHKIDINSIAASFLIGAAV